MTRLQVAIAVIVGYWLGRARHTKPGMMLAAASAGRLAGSPQEMVDQATKLLQSAPEFAALDESVRGQLLESVRVAAMTAGTARIDADTDRLVAGGGDEVLQTAHKIEDTADMAGDVLDDDTVGHLIDGTETTATDVGKGVLGVAGALTRRRRAARPRAPAADTSEHVDDAGPGDEADTDNDTKAATAGDAPTAGDDHAAASPPPTAEVRAWARAHGLPVSDRGRLRAEIWEAYATVHPGH
ncbi:Lsr2 family DNA-binding protein [Rhodococcus jostii]